jgi:hypothetical protein
VVVDVAVVVVGLVVLIFVAWEAAVVVVGFVALVVVAVDVVGGGA